VSSLLALLAILGALAIGAISPGPSFVLVVRTSIAQSRRDGLAAALGMGAGGVVFAALALLGLQALLMQAAWLYLALKVAGGAYLIYLGIRLWRGAGAPLTVGVDNSGIEAVPGRSFLMGLITQLSNPKTAVVYASIFAALLPAQPPFWLILLLPPLAFLVEAGWYSVVALLFSSPRSRSAYLWSKRWIDRAAGAVLCALGVRLILEGTRPA
jgi:RhtB (resistance to homoserine/threonine) family protein